MKLIIKKLITLNSQLITFFAFLCVFAWNPQESNAQHIEVIGISNPVTISGNVVPAFVTGITNIRLTRTDAAVTVNGVEIGSTGYYKFDFSALTPSEYEGYYKLYISDIEKQEYGVIQIATFVDNAGTVAMLRSLDLGSQRIVNLARPTTNTDAVSRIYLTDSNYTKSQSNALYPTFSFLSDNHYTKSQADTHFVLRTGNNTITGANTYSGTMAVTGSALFGATSVVQFTATETSYPKLNAYMLPPTQNHLTPKKYVDDAINTAIVALGEGYVESPNYIWLAPDIGVSGVGYVATTFAGLNNNINAKTPTADNRINTIIKGLGTANTDGYIVVATGTYEGATQYFEDFTTYTGASNGIKLFIPDDGFSTATLGNIILSNLTIIRAGSDATPTFTRYIFQDCTFIMSGDNTLSFTDSEFRGSNKFVMGTGALTFTNCTGARVTTNVTPVRTGSNLLNFETSN